MPKSWRKSEHLRTVEKRVADVHQRVVEHLLAERAGADLPLLRLEDPEIAVLPDPDLAREDLPAQREEVPVEAGGEPQDLCGMALPACGL